MIHPFHSRVCTWRKINQNTIVLQPLFSLMWPNTSWEAIFNVDFGLLTEEIQFHCGREHIVVKMDGRDPLFIHNQKVDGNECWWSTAGLWFSLCLQSPVQCYWFLMWVFSVQSVLSGTTLLNTSRYMFLPVK